MDYLAQCQAQKISVMVVTFLFLNPDMLEQHSRALQWPCGGLVGGLQAEVSISFIVHSSAPTMCQVHAYSCDQKGKHLCAHEASILIETVHKGVMMPWWEATAVKSRVSCLGFSPVTSTAPSCFLRHLATAATALKAMVSFQRREEGLLRPPAEG